MQCLEKNFGYIMLKFYIFFFWRRIKYSMFNNILYEILKLNCFYNINLDNIKIIIFEKNFI